MLNDEYKDSPLRILSLKGNEALAWGVTDQVGAEPGRCSVKRFSDGEIQIDIEESVHDCDVFIIQPTSCPINLHLMELLIMIDAYGRASAATINIVVPYYGYAKQNRKAHNRGPVTVKLVTNLIETAGITHTIVLDLHIPQIQGFFDVPIDHLTDVLTLAKHFKDDLNINPEECIVASPDRGGVIRARKLADILRAPIAITDKRRPRPSVTEVMNTVGEIEGYTVIIIDGVIDTAGTITLAAQALKGKDVKKICACCIYPVLSGPTEERIENSTTEELVVINSTHLNEDRKPPNTKKLSVAGLIAQAIIHVYRRESVSVLFD